MKRPSSVAFSSRDVSEPEATRPPEQSPKTRHLDFDADEKIFLRVSQLDGVILLDTSMKLPLSLLDLVQLKEDCLGTRRAACRLFHGVDEVDSRWLGHQRGLVEINAVFVPLSAPLVIRHVLQRRLRELAGTLSRDSRLPLLWRIHESVEKDDVESTLAVYSDAKVFWDRPQLKLNLQLLLGFQIATEAPACRGVLEHLAFMTRRLPNREALCYECEDILLHISYIAIYPPTVRPDMLRDVPFLADLSTVEMTILEAYLERFAPECPACYPDHA